MRRAHRIGIAVMTAALAAGWSVGHADDPPKQSAAPAADLGLLEFLGSGDPTTDSSQPDDGSWLAYLSQVNIGKVAKASQAQQAPAQQKPASNSASMPPDGDKPNG